MQRSDAGSIGAIPVPHREVMIAAPLVLWLVVLLACEWWKRRKRSELAAIEAVLENLRDRG